MALELLKITKSEPAHLLVSYFATQNIPATIIKRDDAFVISLENESDQEKASAIVKEFLQIKDVLLVHQNQSFRKILDVICSKHLSWNMKRMDILKKRHPLMEGLSPRSKTRHNISCFWFSKFWWRSTSTQRIKLSMRKRWDILKKTKRVLAFLLITKKSG